MEEVERRYVLRVLEAVGGNKTQRRGPRLRAQDALPQARTLACRKTIMNLIFTSRFVGRVMNLRLASFVLMFGFLLVARNASAETFEAPLGARGIALGPDRVACKDAPLDAGWAVEPDGRSLRAPANADAIGKVVQVKIAPSEAACATSTSSVSAVALGLSPSVDSIAIDPDGGRLVAVGRHLRATAMRWSSGTRTGSDTCASENNPSKPAVAAPDTCAFAVPRDLPVDPSTLKIAIFPAGSRVAPDAMFFDLAGHRVADAAFEQPLTEVALHEIVPADASVDLSSGLGRVPLPHADAIASVTCVDAVCEISGRISSCAASAGTTIRSRLTSNFARTSCCAVRRAPPILRRS